MCINIKSERCKKILSTLLRFGVSLFLLVWLLSMIKWELFWSLLTNANVYCIAIGAFLYFTGIIFSTHRWDLALKRLCIPLEWWAAFRLYLEGSFFGNFLPTSVGGDAYKFLVLNQRYPEHKSDIFASMLIERGSGFLVLFIFNLILLPFFFFVVISNFKLFLLEGFVILGLFAIIVTFIFRKFILRLLQRLPIKIRIYEKFINFIDRLIELHDGALIRGTLFWSILFVLNILLGQILYLKAFGVFVNPLFLLFSITIIYIAGVLPVSLNSIGITEGLSIFLYSFIGISPEVSLAVAFIGRVNLLICNLSGGVVYLVRRRIPTRVIK